MKGGVKYVLLTLGVVVFVWSLVLWGLLMVLLFKIHFSNNESEEVPLYQAQQYRYNPLTNESFFGIMKTPNKLADDSFVSFKDDDGFLTLVSNFGDDEYLCLGECYCDDDTRRVSAGVPLVRGLSYLVAAVTSLAAFDVARKHFEEECQDQLIDDYSCPKSNIHAQVDECEKVYVQANTNNNNKVKVKKKSQADIEAKKKKKGKVGKSKYQCSGECTLRAPTTKETKDLGWGEGKFTIWTRFKLIQRLFAKRFTCKKLTMEGSVRARDEPFARDNFIHGQLEMFCLSNSEEDFPEKRAGYMYRRSMCSGYYTAKGVTVNPSVVCRRVSEEEAEEMVEE